MLFKPGAVESGMSKPETPETGQTKPDPQEREELAQWQRLVLPVMVLTIVGAGIFFAVTILSEIRELYPRVEHAPASLAPHFEAYEALQPNAAKELAYMRFKALALLEADTLQRRYQQATAATLSRVWTRQMGFIIGMMMALIGSAFILGRIEVRQANLSADYGGTQTTGGSIKAALATSSPGIVLATLGTVLMALVIVIPGRVSTTDVPVYLRLPEMTGLAAGLDLYTEPVTVITDPPPLPEPAGGESDPTR
jgi:hypothetical protein